MALTSETRVRFTADSRLGDWRKGDYGVIDKVIALPPQNLSELYVIRHGDVKVWATEKDIEPVNQLTIWDELLVYGSLAKEQASSDNP